MESWKVITYASNYEVSNYGNVRNIHTLNCLKGRESKSGYLQVSIKYDSTQKFKNQYIHRLVAEFWVENNENKTTVNHKDGNKLNNMATNLEWCTPSEQQIHRVYELKKVPQGKKVGQYTKEGELIQIFNSVQEAANKIANGSRVNIDNAIHHKKNQQTAYGYIWKYFE